jgi:hypothetical protein
MQISCRRPCPRPQQSTPPLLGLTEATTIDSMDPNSSVALLRRRDARTLTWRGLVFILGGTYAAGWLCYGTPSQPYFFGTLPVPAAVYGVLVWPFIWGLIEQMTYNGYLLPRFQVLCRSTSLAIAIVAFVWSLQHAFMPLTFDARFMAFRLLLGGAVLGLPDAFVSATSPVGSVGDCACPVGWCERADRRASSAVEGMRWPFPTAPIPYPARRIGRERRPRVQPELKVRIAPPP